MKLLKGCLFAILFGVVVVALWRYHQPSGESDLNSHLDLARYEAHLIPEYQKKMILVGEILTIASMQDQQIAGIGVHVPHWRADSTDNVSEIEELHAILDTAFSKYVGQLNELERKDRRLHARMDALRTVDRDIRVIRADLGLR